MYGLTSLATLSPWIWVLTEKLVVAQLVNNFSDIHESRPSIVVFTTAFQYSPNWVRWIHIPSKVIEVVTLLNFNQKIPGSDLGRSTDSPQWGFSWVSSDLRRKQRHSALFQSTVDLFYIHWNQISRTWNYSSFVPLRNEKLHVVFGWY